MGRVDSSGNIRLEYKSHTHGIAPCLSHIHRCAECVGQFQFARLDWNNLQYWELHDKYLWILVIFKDKKKPMIYLSDLNSIVVLGRRRRRRRRKSFTLEIFLCVCCVYVCVCVCVGLCT